MTISKKCVIMIKENRNIPKEGENMKKYTTPVLQKLDLSNISVFCGCKLYANDDDSCY